MRVKILTRACEVEHHFEKKNCASIVRKMACGLSNVYKRAHARAHTHSHTHPPTPNVVAAATSKLRLQWSFFVSLGMQLTIYIYFSVSQRVSDKAA